MTTYHLSLIPTLAPHVRLKIDPIDGTPLLLFPEGLITLNESAQAILSLCDGKQTIGDIIRLLGEQFDAAEEILKEDVIEQIELLRKKNLLLISQ